MQARSEWSHRLPCLLFLFMLVLWSIRITSCSPGWECDISSWWILFKTLCTRISTVALHSEIYSCNRLFSDAPYSNDDRAYCPAIRIQYPRLRCVILLNWTLRVFGFVSGRLRVSIMLAGIYNGCPVREAQTTCLFSSSSRQRRVSVAVAVLDGPSMMGSTKEWRLAGVRHLHIFRSIGSFVAQVSVVLTLLLARGFATPMADIGVFKLWSAKLFSLWFWPNRARSCFLCYRLIWNKWRSAIMIVLDWLFWHVGTVTFDSGWLSI